VNRCSELAPSPTLMLPGLLLSLGLVLLPLAPHRPAPLRSMARAGAVVAGLDYKDPTVAAEFATVQSFSTEELEKELADSGIIAPPTMNEVDLRLMLVELRMRKSGTLPGKISKKQKPASYSSKYEEALWEKPGFKALMDEFRQQSDTNAFNLAMEYMNNPKQAMERYGGTVAFDKTIARIQEALTKKVEQKVTSGRLTYSGFPSSMGEVAIKMTLAAFGEVVSVSVEEADDGLTVYGKAEFETADAAKACIDKYDGVDMGLGTKLSFIALP